MNIKNLKTKKVKYETKSLNHSKKSKLITTIKKNKYKVLKDKERKNTVRITARRTRKRIMREKIVCTVRTR
jgi:hypothetical protein